MRAFLAVLWRELAERWLILVAAAALSLLPLAAHLLPLPGYRGPELRGGVALGLGLIVSFLLALVLGSSILARDLGERRLGFYFSRPLPGLAIWGGKLAAAFLLALGSGLLVGAPTALLGDGIDLASYWGTNFSLKLGFAANLGLWMASLAFLVLLANAGSTMVRARSAWLLLDLAGATLLAALIWVESSRLLTAQAIGAFFRAELALLAAGIAALAAASAVQMVRARTDPRLGHRLLSLTLWSLLGVAVLAISGYGRWVLAASPKDLEQFLYVEPAPAGDWISMNGAARGRAGFQPTFLFDTRSGAYIRAPEANWIYGAWDGAEFSADGRRAVWLDREDRRARPLRVRRLDLDRPGARPTFTQIGFEAGYPRDLALSRDGRLLAVIRGDRVLAWDLDSGRALVAVPIPVGGDLAGDQQRLLFLPSGVLRFYNLRGAVTSLLGKEGSGTIQVIDIDPGTGRVVGTLDLPTEDERLTQISPDGRRLVVQSRRTSPSPPDFRVVDLATGVFSPAIASQGTTARASFLHDGRPVVWSRRDREATLRLFDLQGAEVRRFTIAADRMGVGGQTAPGRLVVVYEPSASDGKSGWKSDGKVDSLRSAVLDLERGTLRTLGEGIVPVASPGLAPGSPGTRLFWQDGGGLVEVDPATGRRRVILKQKEPRGKEAREDRWGKGS